LVSAGMHGLVKPLAARSSPSSHSNSGCSTRRFSGGAQRRPQQPTGPVRLHKNLISDGRHQGPS
jgi:hypothetical protein